tara:strand:- start:2711 stop:3442 length:732 start_codon:yes stop_codon:yes gene_type:complete
MNYFKYVLVLFFSIVFSSVIESIDSHQENNDFQKALELTLSHYESNKEDVEILWRLARGYFDLADQTSDEEIKKMNIDRGLPYAKLALDINPLSAKANHWYAVMIGQKGVLEGTKQKILNSYEVKKYCLKAIEIDPSYDGSLHVMGRWHYNVADLSWIERTIASAVYATPPKGSFDEAIDYFKQAMEANPDDIRHYLWLGKSYHSKGDDKQAEVILNMGIKLEVNSDGDRILKQQVEELLSQI